MNRDTPVATDAHSFCREARRLRASLAGNPVRMHRQLGRLSIKPATREAVRVQRIDEFVAPPAEDVTSPSAVNRSFREHVERTLAGQYRGVLRYSERLEMVEDAGRRGIGRFEANLIIASVQYRLQMSSGGAGAPTGTQYLFAGVLAFLVVQGMIVLAYWRMFQN